MHPENIFKHLKTSIEHLKRSDIILRTTKTHPELNSLVQLEQDFNTYAKKSRVVKIGYLRPDQFLDHLTVITKPKIKKRIYRQSHKEPVVDTFSSLLWSSAPLKRICCLNLNLLLLAWGRTFCWSIGFIQRLSTAKVLACCWSNQRNAILSLIKCQQWPASSLWSHLS